MGWGTWPRKGRLFSKRKDRSVQCYFVAKSSFVTIYVLLKPGNIFSERKNVLSESFQLKSSCFGRAFNESQQLNNRHLPQSYMDQYMIDLKQHQHLITTKNCTFLVHTIGKTMFESSEGIFCGLRKAANSCHPELMFFFLIMKCCNEYDLWRQLQLMLEPFLRALQLVDDDNLCKKPLQQSYQ